MYDKVNEANLAASECKYICNEDTKTELYQYIHRYTTIHLGLQDMTKSGKVTTSQCYYFHHNNFPCIISPYISSL
jgi:hypothetical protein